MPIPMRDTVYLIWYSPYERVYLWITNCEVFKDGFPDKSMDDKAFFAESISVKVQALFEVKLIWQLNEVIAGTDSTSERFKLVGEL